MAINIDPILSGVNDLCSAEKVDINEAIFEAYIQDESFTAHHAVLTEIRNGRLIPIINARPDYGYMKVAQGSCQVNVCDISSTSSVKKWAPVDYNCRLEICKEDLDCDFRSFWNMKCKDFDNMQDAFIQFIVGKVKENLNASQWRIAYFDDSANTNPDYAGIDGLFKQYLAIAPVGSDQHFVIPENAEATIPDQMALDPARGYNIFKAMHTWAAQNNAALLSKPDVHFDTTPEIAFNYLQWLMDNKEINCCYNGTGNDGVTKSGYSIDSLNYLGVPIRIRHEWSNIIKWDQEQSGAANYDSPHRVLLTTKGNKPIGTCDSESFSDFDMWYERKDKLILIDVATSFDAKVVVDKDFAIAI